MTALPRTAEYFPFARGRYEVSPGLFQFGTDFGNGKPDRQVFQIDSEFERYHSNKIAARRENLRKYYGIERFSVAEAEVVMKFIVSRLASEYPQWVTVERDKSTTRFQNMLTGDRLIFDEQFRLIDAAYGKTAMAPAYVSALDALACQVPEDLAVVSVKSDVVHWISAIHACAPNYWAPADKVGQTFASIHSPVAGMESTNRAQQQMVNAMIFKGPYVRFSWGLVTDCYLNHHPQPAPGHDPAIWQGRIFDPMHPALFLRVERQVAWGFPEIGAALFTIRTYVQDCAEITRNITKRTQLIAAIKSMTEAQLRYKGLLDQKEGVLQWLKQPG